MLRDLFVFPPRSGQGAALQLTPRLRADAATRWHGRFEASDALDAGLALHLAVVALVLLWLALGLAVILLVIAAVQAVAPTPAGPVWLWSTGGLAGLSLLMGLALRPGLLERGGKAPPWRDRLRLAVLKLTVPPSIGIARAVRLLREPAGGSLCGFRGCRSLLRDPVVRCGFCDAEIGGTWPRVDRPLFVPCPTCGHAHPTWPPWLVAEAIGTLRVRHKGCPRQSGCRPAAAPLELLLAPSDGRTLLGFVRAAEGVWPPGTALPVPAAMAGPTPWPRLPDLGVAVQTALWTDGEVPPAVGDAVIFLVPAEVAGTPGLSLTFEDLSAALTARDVASPSPIVGSSWKRLRGRNDQLPELPDCRIVPRAVWLPLAAAGEREEQGCGRLAILTDTAALHSFLARAVR